MTGSLLAVQIGGVVRRKGGAMGAHALETGSEKKKKVEGGKASNLPPTCNYLHQTYRVVVRVENRERHASMSLLSGVVLFFCLCSRFPSAQYQVGRDCFIVQPTHTIKPRQFFFIIIFPTFLCF